MALFLFCLAGLAACGGGEILLHSQSAVHEIEGLLLFLISAVFISGASIVVALGRREMPEVWTKPHPVSEQTRSRAAS